MLKKLLLLLFIVGSLVANIGQAEPKKVTICPDFPYYASHEEMLSGE